MRISDWSSDVCSSDLNVRSESRNARSVERQDNRGPERNWRDSRQVNRQAQRNSRDDRRDNRQSRPDWREGRQDNRTTSRNWRDSRSEEHTSELQSLMRISYAVFCLKKKKKSI